MSNERRLLILSCSQQKRPDPGILPAIERYDGPAFKTLRKFLRKQTDNGHSLTVYVLSAAYGLIPADHPIAWYDQVMTPQRAAELRGEALNTFAELFRTGYTDLCVAMSKKYLKALEGWAGLVPSGTSVTVVNGPQGLGLAQLKRWLWGRTEAERGRIPKARTEWRGHPYNGIVQLRGVELQLTPEQVLDQAREALSRDNTGAACFREWYVEIDGNRISPKWLVSVLTGLPVSAFTAREARRVLHQLGIRTQPIVQEEVSGQ